MTAAPDTLRVDSVSYDNDDDGRQYSVIQREFQDRAMLVDGGENLDAISGQAIRNRLRLTDDKILYAIAPGAEGGASHDPADVSWAHGVVGGAVIT